MRIISLILIGFCLSLNIQAQISFKEATDIEVIFGGDSINDPFTAGYNSVQFGEIDLNLDGIKDLVLYDRFQGKVRPYINRGIMDSVSYFYDASYSYLFPPMDQFLLTADYNNDGKFDLYVGGSNIKLYENISTTSSGLQFQFVKTLTSIFSQGSAFQIPINPTGSNLPAIYDIDNDNDLDLFVNQGSRTIDYHRNLSIDSSSNFDPDFERRSRCWGSFFEGFNKAQTSSDSIYLDSCYGFLTRGERVSYDDPKTQHHAKGLKHGGGLTITALDYDGNSSTDLLIADDGASNMQLLLNADSVAPYIDSRMFSVHDSFPNYDVPVDILFPAAFLIDVNNDGKKDMIVTSNQTNNGLPPFSKDDIWLYENVAQNGNFRFEFRTKNFLMNETLDFGRESKPVFIDYNKDGLMDILVGNGGYLSPNSDSIFIGQLALLENIGTLSKPRFEVIDYNYLNLPSINMGVKDTLFANLSPTIVDIDGDNDEDILITQKNGDIFLFEDTSSTGNIAEFKFHPGSFQFINDNNFQPKSCFLYDIDSNGILEMIINTTNRVKYLSNFGTSTQPLFNIPVDSLYWVAGDTMRYHLSSNPNYSLFNINDSVAINNAANPNNNTFIPLKITKIDSTNGYLDCINHISQGVGSNKYDEANSNAHLTFFNNTWNFLNAGVYFSVENTFMFKDKGENQFILGAEDGNNYLAKDFIDSLQTLDTITNFFNNTFENYGRNSFINGADINNDQLIDLVVGGNAGGLKILYGVGSVGLEDITDNNSTSSKELFTIYPNPTNSTFTIKLKDNKNQNYTVEILDMSGKLIQQQISNTQNLQFSSEKLAKGVYLIRLSNQENWQVQKLVVKP